MVSGQQMWAGMNYCELSFVSELRMHCQRQFHSACAAAYDNNSHSCVRGCRLEHVPNRAVSRVRAWLELPIHLRPLRPPYMRYRLC